MNYLIDELSVTEDEIQNLTYKEFLNTTIKLNLEFYDVIMEFYKIRLSAEYMVFNDGYPEYCETTNNYRCRFLILKVEDDYVFVNLKVVDPQGKDRYFHIYRPISYNRKQENEDYILKVLFGISYIKGIITIRQDGDYNTCWANNYYNTRESCKFLFDNKFEKKRKIKFLKRITDIKIFDYCDDTLKDEILGLLSLWEENRGPKGASDRKSLTKILPLTNKQDNLYVIVGRIDNKTVFYQIVFVYLNKYVISRSSKAIGVLGKEVIQDYLSVDEKTSTYIIKGLNSLRLQWVHNYFLVQGDCEAFYLEGDGKLKGLRTFKQEYFKNVLFYNRVPLEDYVKGE